MNSNEECSCASNEHEIQAGFPMTCDECIKDMEKTGEIRCKTPTPTPTPPDNFLDETKYCEECKEDHPEDTFKESEKWCSKVCQSCWEKEGTLRIEVWTKNNILNQKCNPKHQPPPPPPVHQLTDEEKKQNNIISLKPPMSWLLNWEIENLKKEHKMKEFYIERDAYDKREKARKIIITQERFNLRSSGATEKEIHKWGQKHRRNTNDRFNRFFNKWEDQIHEDNKLNGKKF